MTDGSRPASGDHWWRRPEVPDYSRLIEHQTAAPVGERLLPAPVPARCTARTYGGQLVTVEGVVTHAAGNDRTGRPRWLAFTAEYDGWGKWAAWVSRDACEPLPGLPAPPPASAPPAP